MNYGLSYLLLQQTRTERLWVRPTAGIGDHARRNKKLPSLAPKNGRTCEGARPFTRQWCCLGVRLLTAFVDLKSFWQFDFSVIDSDISEEYFVPKLLLCPQSLGLTAGF